MFFLFREMIAKAAHRSIKFLLTFKIIENCLSTRISFFFNYLYPYDKKDIDSDVLLLLHLN